MADQIKGTWKNISSTPAAKIGSVTVQGATAAQTTQVDLSGVLSHLESLAGATETSATHMGHLTTYGVEALQENNEAIARLAIHMESLSKELREAGITFQKTMQSLKLNAEIPITAMSVGLPRALVLGLVLSPPIYGVITWLALTFIR